MKELIKRIVPKKLYSFNRLILKNLNRVFDAILIPITILSCLWLRSCRKISFYFPFPPITKKILLKIGVFPIVDHYYEPMFNPRHLRKSLREDRFLPAIDFNVKYQLDLMNKFNFSEELLSFPKKRSNNELEFCYDDGPYPSGDSECLYCMIRIFKPNRIIEIGGGSSTLMASNAIKMNKKDDSNYSCFYMCIEPYKKAWLEKTGLDIIRKKVEEVPLNTFRSLHRNDILFIDSSHIIRPQGDVLYEILEILPILDSGVMVHFHDICTPKDYFDEWVCNNFWNEQYILEAFLSFNKEFEIVLSTNYLLHHHYEKFVSKLPIFKIDKDEKPIRETSSFWIRKI